MLILWIRKGGSLKVGSATITVLPEPGNGGVRLGIEAPPTVSILRDNAQKRTKREMEPPRLVEVETETEGQLAMRADHTRTINGIYDPKPAEQWGRRPKRA